MSGAIRAAFLIVVTAATAAGTWAIVRLPSRTEWRCIRPGWLSTRRHSAKTGGRRMKSRRVVVNDRRQTGYMYYLSKPTGRNFEEGFEPELTPREMLALGVDS